MSDRRFRTIGILGGMGPEATILLQQRLLAAVDAQDDADHLPLLIDMNPQVPSRIAHLIEGTGESPAPVLAEMARKLEASGAAALAMPCNTAHHYAPAIRAAVAIPFLDMVALSAAEVASRAPSSRAPIGMLASPATRLTGLFDKALAAHGLTALWPEEDDAPLSAIREIKRTGASASARAALGALSADLQARGATLQMIACSEFSMISDATAPGTQVLDTLDVLANAIQAFATSMD